MTINYNKHYKDTAQELIRLIKALKTLEDTGLETARDLSREIENIGRELMASGGKKAHLAVFKLVEQYSETDEYYLLASLWDFLGYEC